MLMLMLIITINTIGTVTAARPDECRIVQDNYETNRQAADLGRKPAYM